MCEAPVFRFAGGHSIDNPEPIYGLVAIGLVHPSHIKRKQSRYARATC
jgi:selenide,water dikinase